MTRFFMVRHAVTAHTGHRLSGWEDPPLTAEGKMQAERAAGALAERRFDVIVASPLKRCYETAAIVAGPHSAEVEVDEEVGEVHYGRWTNKTFAQLRRLKDWDKVQTHPSSFRFPDGETLREVQARAIAALERLSLRYPKGDVCCVSHADVIRLLAAHHLGVHIDLFQRIVIDPASISVFSIGGRHPVIDTLNWRP